MRIGLHQGEAEERDANYFGPTVNQAARVMAVAHGGQTLLTDGVRDSSDASITDLGTHMLRDIEAPVHLSQLGTTEFPPLSSLCQGIVSLPSPRTSLIGREDSIVEVRRLLADHRLVTLAGVGGCGKTRLAIEVAYREIPAHPDGVWFVDLSTIADSVALPGVIATTLDLAISSGRDAIDQIATYLAPRHALVVIDNCEHVIDPVADLLDSLLERCPGVRFIATSREALDIDGEFTWKVPSLATGSDAPAVDLFYERALAGGAALVDDDQTRQTVHQVVERLDGIPLAIELAAARTRSMPVAEILELLDDRFSLLSGGSRRSRQRQATLEGAVQWSYDLLDESEQEMLRILSVFQGGFSLPDVAAVARRSERETRDLIDALVAKSLVDVVRDASGEFRSRLLETIRLFALARLVDAGEAVATRDRHLGHFSWGDQVLTLARWWTKDHVIRAGREYENFRSAITWSLERGRAEPAVRIAIMCTEAAAARGEVELAIRVLRSDADLSPAEEGFRHAMLAWALATVSFDAAGALEACQTVREISNEHPGDYLITALITEGGVVGLLGDSAGSGERYYEALDIAKALGDVNLVAGATIFTAANEISFYRFDESTLQLTGALTRAPDFGFRHVVEANLAESLLLSGDVGHTAEVASGFRRDPPRLTVVAHQPARLDPHRGAHRRRRPCGPLVGCGGTCRGAEAPPASVPTTSPRSPTSTG